MIWLNPWALLGMGSLVVPLLVHLLKRNQARVRRIATLRFLEATPPASTRPTQITDPLLLLVRLLILAVAVAALARPTASTSPMSGAGREPVVTRVILVDASPSMSRLTPEGEPALDVARRRALEEIEPGTPGTPESAPGGRGQRDAARPGRSPVLEVRGSGPSLGIAIRGAAAYLEDVPGRREILVYSVFGAGTLPLEVERARVHGIPVVLEQIPLAAPAVETLTIPHLAAESRIEVLSVNGGVGAAWDRTDPAPGVADSLLRAGPAFLAADISGAPAPDPGFPVILSLAGGAIPPGAVATGWVGTSERVGDFVLALRRDPGLGAAVPHAGADTRGDEATWWDGLERSLHEDGGAPTASPVVLRTREGDPVAMATPARVNGEPGLIVASPGGPEAFLSAILLGAVGRATRGEASSSELDPRVHSAEEIRVWNHLVGGAGPAGSAAVPEAGPGQREEGEPDPARGSGEARLLWALVLLLLSAEWRLRLKTGANR
ncbi:hypothetical protein BH23GEM11_BH23GEM11_19700 [soil metagenome]